MLPLFAEEMLSRRPRKELKGEDWFGDPERPRVVTERRRRWALAAAWVMGPGICWVGGELELVSVLFAGAGRETDWRPVPKRSAKVWPAKEERRARVGGGDCWSSFDIVVVRGGEEGWNVRRE